ncbi:barstar family protein [Asanoa hainanensis]|uniref:barstar family protein n=1 Tax=Asanoa hainanensis TaxID=560556 RepID=UPI0015C5A6B0|nr:barstar family protein [Asanoa hainanensis]
MTAGWNGPIVMGADVLVEIPGSQVRTELDFHQALASRLDFGPYYGRNLDALWDRLSADIERPVHLVWHDADVSRRQLGPQLYDRIRKVLDDVVERDERHDPVERFTYELR